MQTTSNKLFSGEAISPEPGDSLEPALWTDLLDTAELGRRENAYARTMTSTSTVLRQMATEGAPHGSLALCEQQTAGRGRLGRTWVSKPGAGLWLSVLLRPALDPASAPLLTFCAALAMRRAVLEACGLDCGVKWPNDLVHEGRKLCGILLEVSAETDRLDWVIVGTGLNVYPYAVPEELRAQAASVADYTAPPPRRAILTRYLKALEHYADLATAGGWKALSGDYRAVSATLGKAVHVSGSVEMTGVAEDIDASGALLVRTDEGLRRVLAGDVSVRGLMGYV